MKKTGNSVPNGAQNIVVREVAPANATDQKGQPSTPSGSTALVLVKPQPLVLNKGDAGKVEEIRN